IRQVLGQPVRVAHRNHLVMEALHNQGWVMYAFQVDEALAGVALPLAKSGYLRLGNVRPGGRVAVVLSLHQSRDERLASSLARGRRCEEDLLEHGIAAIPRILERLYEARFLEVHDVLAATRSRADEDHPTNDRRTVLRYLLGDHSAEGETKDIASC